METSETQQKLIEYSWWGGINPPPENLKTKKQLSELGLSPKAAIAFIPTKKFGDVYLYDPDNPESAKPKRKPSPAQLEALARSRQKRKRKLDFDRWLEHESFIHYDRIYAIRWAREMLESDFCILDTETTGLDGEIVEIAVVDKNEQPLIDTLIKPTAPIPEDAIEVHGITNEMVADAPTFLEIWQDVAAAIADKELIIYNSSFDLAAIKRSIKANRPQEKLKFGKLQAHCLMLQYAEFYGDWSDKYEDYKYQPLNGGHRALGDCLAALDVLREMAAADESFWCPAPEYLPEEFRQLADNC